MVSPSPRERPMSSRAVSASEMVDLGTPVLRPVRARLQRRIIVIGWRGGRVEREEE
jgi:hypothetical protein